MSYQINQELCSCCHRCRIECPKSAIRFHHAKYWIDPEKCVSCGKCASVCHNGCISNPARQKTIVPHALLKYECDVCVIGGGGAGMVAAAKAVSIGQNVIVVEKTMKSAVAHGMRLVSLPIIPSGMRRRADRTRESSFTTDLKESWVTA